MPFGYAGASYYCHGLIKMLADYVSITNKKFCFNYIDDVIEDLKYENDDKFGQICRKLGIFLNNGKEFRGKALVFCGFIIDLETKSVRVKIEIAERLERMAGSILKGDNVSFLDLEIFMGIVEFCQLVCTEGRTNSFYLLAALGKTAALGRVKAEDETITVCENMRKELKFWQNIKEHRILKMRYITESTHWIEAYTDASSKRWAVQMGEEKSSQNFETEEKNKNIYIKELKAVLKLFKLYLEEEGRFIKVNVDNKAVTQSLLKKKGSTMEANEIIAEILKIINHKTF